MNPLPPNLPERAAAVFRESTRVAQALQDGEALLDHTYGFGLDNLGGHPDAPDLRAAFRTVSVHIRRLQGRAAVLMLANELPPENAAKAEVLKSVR